jgi:hypothetical protein
MQPLLVVELYHQPALLSPPEIEMPLPALTPCGPQPVAEVPRNEVAGVCLAAPLDGLSNNTRAC